MDGQNPQDPAQNGQGAQQNGGQPTPPPPPMPPQDGSGMGQTGGQQTGGYTPPVPPQPQQAQQFQQQPQQPMDGQMMPPPGYQQAPVYNPQQYNPQQQQGYAPNPYMPPQGQMYQAPQQQQYNPQMPPQQMGGQPPMFGGPIGGDGGMAPPGYGQMQPGMQGTYGAGGNPQGGGFMPPPPPPPPVEDTTPANFQLGAKLPPVLKVKVPPHELKFDEQYFLHLLAGSISLTKEEKRKIVESVPKLRQSQVDELVRIFEEERKKFAELSKKHTTQLEGLAQKHYNEWMELETETEQKVKAQEDEAKAEAIRKQLGI